MQPDILWRALQCKQMSNHYAVHLKLIHVVCQLHLNKIRTSYEIVLKEFGNKSKILSKLIKSKLL